MVDWSKTESEIDRRIEKLEQELDLEIRTRNAAQDDVLKLEAKVERLEKAAAGFIAMYRDMVKFEYWPKQLRELKAALEESSDE